MKETIAQEAKRILSPIPEEEWMTGMYTDCVSKCCARGHWSRLHSSNPSNYGPFNCNDTFEEEARGFARASQAFMKKKHPRLKMDGLASVNDGIVKSYPQKTPKGRVMALIDDMIAAGY